MSLHDRARSRTLSGPPRPASRRLGASPCSTLRLARWLRSPSLGFPAAPEAGWRLVGWNDLGMHCLDADFPTFAILPPFNTIHAQLIDSAGLLVTVPGSITVTYEAVADPDRFDQSQLGGQDELLGLHRRPLRRCALRRPGTRRARHAGRREHAAADDLEHGAPPGGAPRGSRSRRIDDAHLGNAYPMMRLVARNGTAVLAETRIVLPVSDEMDCSACHASGSGEAARPTAGWVYDPDPQRDYRRNILRLHDQEQLANPLFVDALAHNGFDPAGLEATAGGGRAVLCAACHPSNALPGSGHRRSHAR